MRASKEIKYYSDEELVEECTKRPINEEAWGEFWNRFYPFIYQKVVILLKPLSGHPEHSDIDDIVQLVFLKIFKSLSKYDHKKSKLATYINLMATHTIFDQLRRYKTRKLVYLEDSETLAAKVFNGEIELEELWQIVLSILEQLEPRNRAIIQGFLEGRSTTDICNQHSIKPSYFYSIISRFKRAIKDALKKSNYHLSD